jgi:hypothetical protein
MARVEIGLRYLLEVTDEFYWHYQGFVSLPVLVYEKPQTTGAYYFGARTLGEILAGYRVNPSIDFRIGVRGLAGYSKYSGSGTRGLSDGAETDFILEVPAELRIYF